MNDFFDRVFPPIDVRDVLTLAKSYEGPDAQRIVKALIYRYPAEIHKCKALPDYSEAAMARYALDVVLDYARYNLPKLFEAMMLERYTAGGMGEETARYFIRQELAAVSRGNFYSNGGRKWV
jgi:hypothetical protein